MVKIWIVRHAESTSNAFGVADFDVDLSPHGVKQAKRLTGDFDLVIRSPLLRAQKTLEHSQINYKEVIVMEEARELKTHIGDFKHGEERIEETRAEMMERMEVLKARIRELAKERPGQKFLLVTHYYTVIHFTWNSKRNSGIYLDNAEMIEYDI